MNIRKLMSIFICCAILFTLSSCANTINEAYNESSQANPSESESSNVDEKIFDTYLYSTAEDNYILNEQRCTTFDTCEYVDSKAELKKTLNINGIDYTMSYEKTATLSMSDLVVHTYTIDGVENARVLVDAVDGIVIKYINIPYTEILSSEQDYLEFMEAIHPSSNYLSYDYKCMTHCYYISDTEIRSSVENGFLLPNENRNTKAHYFYFTQSIGSIKTDNHISAIFNENNFTLEVYDFNYTLDLFQPLLGSLSKLETELTDYVKDHLKTGYDFSACYVGQKKLFIKDGAPYILTYVSVTFTQTNDQDSSPYTTTIQLINGMKN